MFLRLEYTLEAAASDLCRNLWRSRRLLALAALAWIAALTVPAPAHAQPPGTHPSFVSIQMETDMIDTPAYKQSVCGGVTVDEARKLVITAWHCVPNQNSAIAKLSANDQPVKLIGWSPEADMALFQVENLKGAKAPEFKTPKKGDTVKASSYYDNFSISAQLQDRLMPNMSISVTLEWEGKVAAVAFADKRDMLHPERLEKTNVEWVLVSGTSAPGFSGTPVFDKDGNFVGILTGVNGGFTAISSWKNALELLKGMPK